MHLLKQGGQRAVEEAGGGEPATAIVELAVAEAGIEPLDGGDDDLGGVAPRLR